MSEVTQRIQETTIQMFMADTSTRLVSQSRTPIADLPKTITISLVTIILTIAGHERPHKTTSTLHLNPIFIVNIGQATRATFRSIIKKLWKT